MASTLPVIAIDPSICCLLFFLDTFGGFSSEFSADFVFFRLFLEDTDLLFLFLLLFASDEE